MHEPNLFQIAWKNVATDGSGSTLRRPVFVLSDRFAENFRVKQSGSAEKLLPPPVSGDDVNFYQLAISFSGSLSGCSDRPEGTSVGHADLVQSGEQKLPARPVTWTACSSGLHPVAGSP